MGKWYGPKWTGDNSMMPIWSSLLAITVLATLQFTCFSKTVHNHTIHINFTTWGLWVKGFGGTAESWISSIYLLTKCPRINLFNLQFVHFMKEKNTEWLVFLQFIINKVKNEQMCPRKMSQYAYMSIIQLQVWGKGNLKSCWCRNLVVWNCLDSEALAM